MKITKLILPALMTASLNAAEVPRELFGQNLEHTRASITGGLSAETIRNRKFAGKPAPDGVAAEWRACGGRAAYDLIQKGTYTRHANGPQVPRRNEVSAQKIMSLSDGFAGIAQERVALRGGMQNLFKTHLRSGADGMKTHWRIRFIGQDGKELAAAECESVGCEWKTFEKDIRIPHDSEVRVEIGIVGRASGVIGAVSLLPSDSFHGMRRDVIDLMKTIGTSIVRWPGGNFAGDYRWRDGQLDRDERAPLQSHLESETQAYTGGFDSNDIGTDEVLALCEELGATPSFTINAAWDTPEGSAEWVRYCKGKVKHWSLGNEFGYAHMEGPQTPEEYAKTARAHGEAMLKVDPSLKFTSSGHYRQSQGSAWLKSSGIPLSDIAPSIAVHIYTQIGTYDFSTPELVEKTLATTIRTADGNFAELHALVKELPEKLRVSFDEWNFWYSWFREDGPVQGVYTMHFLTRLLRDHEALKLDNACFFQAVSEGAIRVSPFSARLTSTGEAMRLAKGHIGGKPLPVGAANVFATEKNGLVYVTGYNPSVDKPLELELDLPAGEYCGELLTAADALPGTRYERKPFKAASAKITLPPMAMFGIGTGLAARYRMYFADFAALDTNDLSRTIHDAYAADFLIENTPRIDIPDKEIERIFAFRFWSYRKHIGYRDGGWNVSEFISLPPISCPVVHHLREGRWLKRRDIIDDFTRYWFKPGARPINGPGSYINAIVKGTLDREEVTGDESLANSLLDEFVKNYETWERGWAARAWPKDEMYPMGLKPDGFFHDVDDREGTELTLSGNGARVHVNAVMSGEARGIAKIAARCGRNDIAAAFSARAEKLVKLVKTKLWNEELGFFTPMNDEGKLVPVCELHGYTPWYAGIVTEEKFNAAWRYLADAKNGFRAPKGLTFPVMSAPGFKVSYEGHGCQWCGPSWPYATSIALTALADSIHSGLELPIGKDEYFFALKAYAAQHFNTLPDGSVVPWIDEVRDPFTGDWIAFRRWQRYHERNYNHSTFCDLVLSGLLGIAANEKGEPVLHPLWPDSWKNVKVENLAFRGRIYNLGND